MYYMYRDIVCFRIKLSDCLLKTMRRILNFAIYMYMYMYKEERRERVCVCVLCVCVYVCVCVSSLTISTPRGRGVFFLSSTGNL